MSKHINKQINDPHCNGCFTINRGLNFQNTLLILTTVLAVITNDNSRVVCGNTWG